MWTFPGLCLFPPSVYHVSTSTASYFSCLANTAQPKALLFIIKIVLVLLGSLHFHICIGIGFYNVYKKPAEVPEYFIFWNAVINGPLRNSSSSHSVLVICRNVGGSCVLTACPDVKRTQ